MAVHTQLTETDFRELLSHYQLGQFINAKGISDGIENSNYFLITTSGEFVLTIFEEIHSHELEPYLHFLNFISQQGIRVAAPLANQQGRLFNQLARYDDKPYIIAPKLKGRHLQKPALKQCQAIAEELARLHICSQHYSQPFIGIRSTTWLQQLLRANHQKCSTHEQEEYGALLKHYDSIDLPLSMIHGDLFTDNCLFDGDQLSGIIDFFNVGQGPMLFDLAVLINAWASENAKLDIPKATAIIQAYDIIRPLNTQEKTELLATLKVAAMRFYLSRLHSPSTKKPEEFRLLFNHLNTLTAKGLLH